MNSINWSASNIWVLIAQLVKHCSASTEDMGSNPVKLLKGPVLAIMLCVHLLLFWFSRERGVHCYERVLFWPQTKASEFSTSQKWPTRDRSVQCSMGSTGSLNL